MGLLPAFAVVLELFGLSLLGGTLHAHVVPLTRLRTPGSSTSTLFRSVSDHRLAAAVIGGMAGFFVTLLLAIGKVATARGYPGAG